MLNFTKINQAGQVNFIAHKWSFEAISMISIDIITGINK